MKFSKRNKFLNRGQINKSLLFFNLLMTIFYFSWWLNPANSDNKILYSLLFLGEIYHVFMAITFWHTINPGKEKRIHFNKETNFFPTVDIFITVCGEPTEIIRQTAQAAIRMDYPNSKVYLLNDGFVAKKDNWKDVEKVAKELEIGCITRRIKGGAKAGNINHALQKTKGEIVVIFDADMVPKNEFLKKLIPYFKDKNVGFVQSPQYYKNWQNNTITAGAWAQQEFFFGPIMKGKEKYNASFICGTNFAIRRTALMEVGGMQENNIAEDFLTSLLVHAKGWKSYYVNEVLCEGLAPEDMLSYYKQQLRWARGSLEIVFTKNNPFFHKGLNWHQKLEYLSSAMYYFNGLIMLIDLIMPIIFLFFGIRPVAASSTSFALFFVPFIFLNLYTLRLASANQITFRALSFTQSSWTLQLLALRSILLKQNMKFEVTSKRALTGNYLNLAYPHIAYISLGLMGSITAILREGLNSSVITNIAWFGVNVALFLPFIFAAYNPESSLLRQLKTNVAQNEIN
jgi:cellulose synthase (UDP-forming)